MCTKFLRGVTYSKGAEQAMGRWVMGQWVKWVVIAYMFIMQYLSVNCAVLMHLSFTCITCMIDFGVVCLSTCFLH